jgi:hypothetical protein
VGALVTLDLSDDSPVRELPWIITFGPLSDEEEWEPVVCGPYERPHALSLAEAVVADEDLMAVVEPLVPHVSVDQIRGEIAAARLTATEDEAAEADEGLAAEMDRELAAEIEAGYATEHEHVHAEPAEPPPADEVRAGFTRIAARLTGS